MPLPQKTFYMIRHGQTEANLAQVMAGSTDSPLTQVGRDQAKSAQEIVKNLQIKPTAIVHSNLSRARDTASIINEVLDIPMHEDPDLAEIHSGEWEGKPWSECEDLLDGWPTPPGGETFDVFCDRLKRGKKRHLDLHDGPILIVSHGGVFRGLGGIYGLQVPGIFENCHLHEFQPDAGNTHFPWKVWSYRYQETLERSETSIYHESEHYVAEEIAS